MLPGTFISEMNGMVFKLVALRRNFMKRFFLSSDELGRMCAKTLSETEVYENDVRKQKNKPNFITNHLKKFRKTSFHAFEM